MRQFEHGDTIIELVLAFAIFSMAAVGTIAVLNRGVAITQRNLESTLVRQQIDSQAEMIRYVHDSGNPLWATLIGTLTANPASIGTTANQCPTPPNGSFYVRPTSSAGAGTFVRKPASAANFTTIPSTYAMIDYSNVNSRSQGIWLQVTEAENDKGSAVKAYDFYIHACWMSVGTNVPMTLGTIVRLYDN